MAESTEAEKTTEAKLNKFLLQINKDYSATQDQRIAAGEDIRFGNVVGGMWEDWQNETFTDGKPKLEFDITSDYVQRYYGEWTMNRANVSFSPDDESTTDDVAEDITGIYRGEFKDNDGQLAQDTAVGEVAECGYGAFRLSERFIDEEDPENELKEIFWEMIVNAFNTVVWDSNAKRPDKADAKWGAVLTGYTDDAFEEKYPDATPTSAYTPDQRSFTDHATPKDIFVAERYEIVIKKTKFHVYQNVELNLINAYPKDKVDKIKDELLEADWEFVRERTINLKTVEKSIFTGVEFIQEPKRITGKFIPIIPMYGYRKYIDNQEHYYGLVRKRKDPNRLFNSTVSKIAEASASSGHSKPIFFQDQIKGLEDLWADDSDNAYALVRPMLDAQGNPLPIGPVGYTQPIQLDPNTLMASEIATNHVQSTTGGMPQDTIDPQASGKAINALRAIGDLNTQPVTDNIIQSIKHSGVVWLSKSEEIHIGAQTKRSVSEDGSSSIVSINPSILDEDSGRLIPGESLKGKFKVNAEVGPQYETQREATVETLEKVMEMVGQESRYFPPLLAMWMKNISGTGLKELKEFNRQEMLKLQLIKPETPEEEQMLQALSQKIDPQDELVKSAAEQQKAEAFNLTESGKNKAASTKKIEAETQKVQVETVEIVDDIGSKDFEQARSRLN